MHIKKFPKVAVVATKLNFLQYTYRIRINHKTLYSQTFPGPHFGSWTNGAKWLKAIMACIADRGQLTQWYV